jgi:type I restriction enzyme, S subunit
MIGRVAYWKDLERWVPFGALDWEAPHPLVPIGEVIQARREAVRAADFGLAQPITIHFDGSMEPRDRTEAFKGNMFAAYPGYLVFSKIDVRNGAIGIVPHSIPKAVVTTEYPVYRHDPAQLDARFFALVVQSPHFLRTLKVAATGHSGRKRVAPETFEALEIPLPELEVQKRLVEAYFAELEQAAGLEAEAHAKEREALRNFEAELGLAPPPDLPRRLMMISRFRDIQRWSHEGILDQALLRAAGKPTERFPLLTLGEVIRDLRNGWSPQCLERPATEDEWGVLKVGAVSYGWFDDRQNKALPPTLQPKPWLEVKSGEVIISRANILRLVGACAIVWETRPRLLLCDKLFRVEFLKDSPILPDFLAEVLKTHSVRQQIEAGATGTSPTMKNISKSALLEIRLPDCY